MNRDKELIFHEIINSEYINQRGQQNESQNSA